MKHRFTYRIILGWMLLALYLAGSIRTVAPYLEYAFNYDYISKQLCINKAKPQLECNGKCHLNKQIKKVAEEESKNKQQQQNLNYEIQEIPSKEVSYLTAPFSPEVIIEYPQFSQIFSSISPEATTPPPKA